MNLYGAWKQAKGILKPQVQGDCGVYSFWYATVLLRQINPGDAREVIYPRSHTTTKGRAQGAGRSWGTGVTVDKVNSIRHMAKVLLHSGQGEILTAGEMEILLAGFGYKCQTYQQKDGRKDFIKESIKKNRPVIFAYMKGPSGPVSAIPHGRSADCGSHWSLIIDDGLLQYTYLDPHYPNRPQNFLKGKVLDSNEFVDGQTYVRYWNKTASGGIAAHGSTAPAGGKFYDIGHNGRTQNLQYTLVSVW